MLNVCSSNAVEPPTKRTGMACWTERCPCPAALWRQQTVTRAGVRSVYETASLPISEPASMTHSDFIHVCSRHWSFHTTLMCSAEVPPAWFRSLCYSWSSFRRQMSDVFNSNTTAADTQGSLIFRCVETRYPGLEFKWELERIYWI